VVELDSPDHAPDGADADGDLLSRGAERDAIDARRRNVGQRVELGEELLAAPSDRAGAVLLARVRFGFEHDDALGQRARARVQSEGGRDPGRPPSDHNDVATTDHWDTM